ncbi:hypothetical protein A2U01_0065341 [Trifolium medium]|uniref:Uncharacterized protein n=1 Tax=Trifolium medium TaxID=97028 RepID=A0A392S6Q5_9FABA|nr:hypothetical protein [Trifolium medium]
MMLRLTENEDEQLEPDPPEAVIDPIVREDIPHHLSLNAMNGNSGMGIIRFTGTIDNIAVQVLVDGGSSDTYCNQELLNFSRYQLNQPLNFKY